MPPHWTSRCFYDPCYCILQGRKLKHAVLSESTCTENSTDQLISQPQVPDFPREELWQLFVLSSVSPPLPAGLRKTGPDVPQAPSKPKSISRCDLIPRTQGSVGKCWASGGSKTSGLAGQGKLRPAVSLSGLPCGPPPYCPSSSLVCWWFTHPTTRNESWWIQVRQVRILSLCQWLAETWVQNPILANEGNSPTSCWERISSLIPHSLQVRLPSMWTHWIPAATLWGWGFET
jgi:hypothetical protein